ncbi:MAG TPA: DMT family transporter [Ruminiclostridium sp.]|nr:DMT family transporter [Ruminiclostridium sp.]
MNYNGKVSILKTTGESMNEEKHKKLHWLLLFFGIACISISAFFVKKAQVNGISVSFYRVFFATLFILPFYIRAKKKDMNLKGICLSLLGGMLFAFELVFWNTAVIISNTTLPTLIVNLSSVWVGIGAMILFKEKLNRFHWAGNIIAILGVAMIIGINNIIHMKIDTGLLFSIIASIFLALYVLSVKEVRQKYSTIQVVFFTFLGCTITLFICCIVTGSALYGFSLPSWAYLLCLGLITQVGGYFSINYALGYIDSSTVSILTLLQPILTAVFAVIMLNEAFSVYHIIGGVLLLAGLVIALLFKDNGRRMKSVLKTDNIQHDTYSASAGNNEQ